MTKNKRKGSNAGAQTPKSSKRKKKRAAHHAKKLPLETETSTHIQRESQMQERAAKKREKLIRRKIKRDRAKALLQKMSSNPAATPQEMEIITTANGASIATQKSFGYAGELRSPDVRPYTYPPSKHACPLHATSLKQNPKHPVTDRDRTPPSHSDNAAITPSSPKAVLTDVPTTARLPVRIKTAVMLHNTLRTRSTRLQSQVTAIELGLQNARASLGRGDQKADADGQAEMKKRVEGLEEIVALASEHLHSIFILEFALLDIIDEGSSQFVEDAAGQMWCEFEELVKVFAGKMEGAMRKVSEEAVGKSLGDVGIPLRQA